MMNKITIEDIGRSIAVAVDEKKVLVRRIERLAEKLRKLNLMLARETRVTAECEIHTDWEQPEAAIAAIASAKRILARELVDELVERDLFELVIDEQKPYKRLRAELRVLRPLKARETV
ncbi:MAG: hypothetical protein V3S25_11110 [Nitrospirales bacterium]